jgi:hypothetical protein
MVHYTGNKQVVKIMKFLFQTGGPKLERKYARFNDLKTQL